MKTPGAVLDNTKGWKTDREKSQEIDDMMKPYFCTIETETNRKVIIAEIQEIVTTWSTEIAASELHISKEESQKVGIFDTIQ